MKTDKKYMQAMAQAKENYADLKERGTDAIGGNVLEFMEDILTPEEIAESELRVAIIGELIKTRQEKRDKSKEARGIKRSKTTHYCKNGERQHKSAINNHSKGIGSFRQDIGGCSARKQ